MEAKVPGYDQLFNPVLDALRRLKGSATVDELNEEVVNELDLPESAVNQPHRGETSRTELEYRLAWARTYLKKTGYLENSGRGIWSLTAKGKEASRVEASKIVREGRVSPPKRQRPVVELVEASAQGIQTELEVEISWQRRLLDILVQLKPAAFERLGRRLLLESGFVDVVVTGQSGDGGIDGHGAVRLGGLLTFPVIFQCKRYSGVVEPKAVRDFRGAMVGRADRGLIITTGRFTTKARAEARRDGAPPIDLIDGPALAEKLKELRLGVRTETVEHVDLDEPWFRDI